MEAVTAACAMVAFADGVVRPEETAKLIEYIRIDETLQVFDPAEVIGAFERFVDVLGFDFNIGREKAFSALSQVAPRSDEAKLIVLIGCAVGGADEDFNNDQRLMVRQVCTRLGFDPREFDLNLRAPSPKDLPASRPKPRRIVRADVNIPDWMRRPPDPGKRPGPPKPAAPERSPQPANDMPNWMRKPPLRPPEKRSSSAKEEAPERTVPEWMKKPPEPAPKPASGKAPETEIPDWMKKA
jgi:tellurite resistance protein TerB